MRDTPSRYTTPITSCPPIILRLNTGRRTTINQRSLSGIRETKKRGDVSRERKKNQRKSLGVGDGEKEKDTETEAKRQLDHT